MDQEALVWPQMCDSAPPTTSLCHCSSQAPLPPSASVSPSETGRSGVGGASDILDDQVLIHGLGVLPAIHGGAADPTPHSPSTAGGQRPLG